MPEVTVGCSRRQNQIVIVDPYVLLINITYEHKFPALVDACYFSKEYRCVPTLSQNAPTWGSNLPWRKNRGSDLVEQRLKEVVIVTVNQNDLRRRVLKRLGRSQAAKAAAHDHNDRETLAHNYDEAGVATFVGPANASAFDEIVSNAPTLRNSSTMSPWGSTKKAG